MPRMDESSEAVKRLIKMFMEKKITKRTQPLEIHESHKRFQEHKLDNFRTKLNKLKKEYLGGMFTEIKNYFKLIFQFTNLMQEVIRKKINLR